MMITVPHYNKPSQEGIYNHFDTICSNETIRTKPIRMCCLYMGTPYLETFAEYTPPWMNKNKKL